MSQKTMEKSKINLLETIENIIELAEGSKMDIGFFAKAEKDLQALSNEFALTANQALLFATMVNFCSGSRIRTGDLTKFFDCREIKLLRMESDFEALKERKLIRVRLNKEDAYYTIPNEVVATLKSNEIYEFDNATADICTLSDWFDQLGVLYEQRDEFDIDFNTFKNEANELIQSHSEFDFFKKIKQLKIDSFETFLLICICHLFVNNEDNGIRHCDLDEYFASYEQHLLKKFFKKENTPLFEKKIVEWAGHDAGHKRIVKLTDHAKEELLAELDLKAKPKRNFILTETIVQKSLFYNKQEGKQISELQKLLSQDFFKSVQERLKERGMQQGFSCLFYGSPGTGKTESVFQLAKQTGRDLFFVDISDTKSCWFGESEKKIKEVFVKYRNAVKECKVTPILFFNEADAVFGKRKDLSSSNVAQTENAIQNIILQEMETLNGILIATTNLTDNLDLAFERRFVYKIRFEKPTLEVKQKIWQNKLSWLNDDEGLQLAQAFDFSGGEIDNVVRKTTINEVIFGNSTQFSDLEKLCLEERMATRPNIGF